MSRHAGDRVRAGRRAPLVALAAAAVVGTAAACAVAPPPGAEPAGGAGRPHDSGRSSPSDGRSSPSEAEAAEPGDGKARTPPAADPSPPGPHGSTAVRCGPALSFPDGIEARTCVVAQGDTVRARTYYRDAGGEERAVALSLMGPDGRTVLTHCVLDTGDEPALCETPRERGSGRLARYTAIAEFADRTAGERLLLRAGTN